MLWLLMGAPRKMVLGNEEIDSLLPSDMFHDRMPRSAQDSKMESTEVVMEMNIPKEAIGKIIGPKGANKATLEAQIGSTFKVVDVTDPAVITFEGSMEICESLFRLLVNAIKPQFNEKDIQVDIREKVEVEVKSSASEPLTAQAFPSAVAVAGVAVPPTDWAMSFPTLDDAAIKVRSFAAEHCLQPSVCLCRKLGNYRFRFARVISMNQAGVLVEGVVMDDAGHNSRASN